MDIQLNDRLIQLDSEKSRLERMLKDVESEIEVVREAVVKQFLAESTQQWKRRDGAQIYLRRTLYANVRPGCDHDAVCEAMQRCGLAFLVKTRADTTGLKAWVKEQEETSGVNPNGPEEVLPPEVRPFFTIFEKTIPTVRGNTNGGGLSKEADAPAIRGEK